MAAINHSISEQELHDIYMALDGLQKANGKSETGAHRFANDITYGVFRGLLDPESVRRWITQRMVSVFNVRAEKGHGDITDCCLH